MKTDSSGTALRMTKDIKRHTERSEVSLFGKNFCWVKTQPTTVVILNLFQDLIICKGVLNIVKTDFSGTALRMTKDIKRHTERSEVSLFGKNFC